MFVTSKPFYESKTFWAGFALIVGPFLSDVLNLLEVTDGVPAWITVPIGVVIIILRAVTSRPVTLTSTDETFE